MLTDPNKEIIEWSTYSGNGRIEVHNPARLESEVLCRYFRHSKYSSFQRQLNYFGFRKIAGKGKMSPCSYVNDAATLDIQSLLLMKRKCSEKERNLGGADASSEGILSASLPVSNNIKSNKRHLNPGNDIQPVTVQPMFAHRNISFDTMAATVAKNIDIYKQQQSSSSISTANSEFHELKRTKLEQSSLTQEDTDRNGYTIAIGKGVRHQLNGYLRSSSNGSSVINYNNNNATSSSSIHNHNLTWLVHPPSIKATASPAPLQFLDPNELGMSVTSASYLNQLKSNFDASVADYTAATTSAVDAAAIPSSSAEDDTAAAGTDGRYISQAVSISGTSSATTNSATSLSRVSSQASFFGMLRKDDSLINLAMLPTLDTTSNNTNNTDLSSSNNGFGHKWNFGKLGLDEARIDRGVVHVESTL